MQKGTKLKRQLQPRGPHTKIRPERYTKQLYISIINRVAEGEAVSAICREEGMPNRRTVYTAIMADGELRKLWEGAKEHRAEHFFEMAINLSKELEIKGWDKDIVAAIKVAIDTYRWAARMLNPRQYGEHVTAKTVVPIQINTTLNLDPNKPPAIQGPSVYDLKALPVIEIENDPSE